MIRFAPRRFARATPEQASDLFDAVRKNPTDPSLRDALADHLEENNQPDMAGKIRNLNYDPDDFDMHQGKIVPAQFTYYEYPLHQGDDYHEVAQRLDEDGLEGAVDYMSQWEPDEGVPAHTYRLPWGSDDDVDDVLGPDGSVFRVSHNPRMGYIGMTQKVRERPRQMSRAKLTYARATPEQEGALLDAIAKNPNDPSLHDAYADHLEEQGRHGEAAMVRLFGDQPGKPAWIEPHNEIMKRAWAGATPTKTYYRATAYGPDPDRVLITLHQADSTGHRHIGGWYPTAHADQILTALDSQGVSRNERDSKYDYSPAEKPEQYAAYRAPAGGTVVRGTYYQGGKLLPDLEGAFANPPKQEAPVQYPQPKRPSLKERLKAKFSKKEPLVVSYARATPESLAPLMQAAHRNNQMGTQDPSIHDALADALEEVGRNKEAELARSGRYAIDLNGGGRVRPADRPRRIAVTRATGRGTDPGLPYDQLADQLMGGRRVVRIGNNREIRRDPSNPEDIQVLLHGNHVVTAHPNGEYSLFTQNYHTPTTFQVHRQITGESPNRVRGQTMFRGQPFEEGVRFRPQVWNGQEWVQPEG